MITVVLSTFNSGEPLARLLTALTPAAVDGFVQDVVLLDAGSMDATVELAEDAGASIVPGGGLTDAAKLARGEWLLWLPGAARLGADWREALEAHLARPTHDPAKIVCANAGLIARI